MNSAEPDTFAAESRIAIEGRGEGADDGMDFGRRFGGLARLYGEAGLARIVAAHVCVIGVGGVGSWVAEALARSAIGHLTLIDLDHVAESNINRQLQALQETLGMAKVLALQQRIAQINPRCAVSSVEAFVEADNVTALITPEFDYVIDCIDSFRTKAHLLAHCRRHKQKVISVGGAGGQIDPSQIRIADLSRTRHDPLLAKVRKLLRTDFGFSSNPQRKFAIPAVYSEEALVYPDRNGGVCRQKPASGTAGLNCASGFGSVTHVTGSFGFFAAGYVLNRIARSAAA